MKIYEFVHSEGETDWVFAPNIKEAREFYERHTGSDHIDCKVKSGKKSAWKDMYLLDTSESEPDDLDEDEYNEYDYCNGYKIIETFADYAEKNTITDMIATTEF